MIKMVNLFQAIQLPGNAGATSCINLNTHGGRIHLERTDIGIELHFGKTVEGKWQPSGEVKTATWANVADFSEERGEAKQQVKK